VGSSYSLRQGQIREREGRLEAAREAYRAALRWDRASPDANFNFVRALAKGGDLPGALAQSRVASVFVNEPELIILRSRIQQNAGYRDQAINELRAGIRVFPYSQELREELASCASIEATATGR
jgi:tetratricopeptide (TPR) repeat protein